MNVYVNNRSMHCVRRTHLDALEKEHVSQTDSAISPPKKMEPIKYFSFIY